MSSVENKIKIKVESASGLKLPLSLYMLYFPPFVFRIMDREHTPGARYFVLNFTMRYCKEPPIRIGFTFFFFDIRSE